jgi:hypothetical protein
MHKNLSRDTRNQLYCRSEELRKVCGTLFTLKGFIFYELNKVKRHITHFFYVKISKIKNEAMGNRVKILRVLKFRQELL